MIKKSVKRLDGQKVQAGYFSSQGKHSDGQYSYVGLVQALELGYFPAQGITRAPMPFMHHIGAITKSGLKRDAEVKRAFKTWSSTIHRKNNPSKLLNAMGMRAVRSSRQVFNNPAYFPQAPKNKTPLVDSGELRENFSYMTSWDRSVRRK